MDAFRGVAEHAQWDPLFCRSCMQGILSHPNPPLLSPTLPCLPRQEWLAVGSMRACLLSSSALTASHALIGNELMFGFSSLTSYSNSQFIHGEERGSFIGAPSAMTLVSTYWQGKWSRGSQIPRCVHGNPRLEASPPGFQPQHISWVLCQFEDVPQILQNNSNVLEAILGDNCQHFEVSTSIELAADTSGKWWQKPTALSWFTKSPRTTLKPWGGYIRGGDPSVPSAWNNAW